MVHYGVVVTFNP